MATNRKIRKYTWPHNKFINKENVEINSQICNEECFNAKTKFSYTCEFMNIKDPSCKFNKNYIGKDEHFKNLARRNQSYDERQQGMIKKKRGNPRTESSKKEKSTTGYIPGKYNIKYEQTENTNFNKNTKLSSKVNQGIKSGKYTAVPPSGKFSKDNGNQKIQISVPSPKKLKSWPNKFKNNFQQQLHEDNPKRKRILGMLQIFQSLFTMVSQRKKYEDKKSGEGPLVSCKTNKQKILCIRWITDLAELGPEVKQIKIPISDDFVGAVSSILQTWFTVSNNAKCINLDCQAILFCEEHGFVSSKLFKGKTYCTNSKEYDELLTDDGPTEEVQEPLLLSPFYLNQLYKTVIQNPDENCIISTHPAKTSWSPSPQRVIKSKEADKKPTEFLIPIDKALSGIQDGRFYKLISEAFFHRNKHFYVEKMAYFRETISRNSMDCTYTIAVQLYLESSNGRPEEFPIISQVPDEKCCESLTCFSFKQSKKYKKIYDLFKNFEEPDNLDDINYTSLLTERKLQTESWHKYHKSLAFFALYLLKVSNEEVNEFNPFLAMDFQDLQDRDVDFVEDCLGFFRMQLEQDKILEPEIPYLDLINCENFRKHWFDFGFEGQDERRMIGFDCGGDMFDEEEECLGNDKIIRDELIIADVTSKVDEEISAEEKTTDEGKITVEEKLTVEEKTTVEEKLTVEDKITVEEKIPVEEKITAEETISVNENIAENEEIPMGDENSKIIEILTYYNDEIKEANDKISLKETQNSKDIKPELKKNISKIENDIYYYNFADIPETSTTANLDEEIRSILDNCLEKPKEDIASVLRKQFSITLPCKVEHGMYKWQFENCKTWHCNAASIEELWEDMK